MGLVVEGEALLEVIGDELASFIVGHACQHRARLVGMRHTQHDVVYTHGEMYGCPVFEDETYILVVARSAATSCHDGVFHCAGADEHLSFDDAESGFTVTFKEEWYGGFVFFLDCLVGVDKVVANQLSELSTEGAFASIAVSDKVDYQGVNIEW